MSRFAHDERLALADLMAKTGPDAPTLCGGWTVRDLLAHLILRERRPDAALGILVKRFAGRTEQVQRQLAARDFAAQLSELRQPPWWNPLTRPPFDELVNLTEMFVHFEDVRRASPTWTPRQLSAEIQKALWKMVQRRARLALRRLSYRVRIAAPGFGVVFAGKLGPDAVTVTGDPAELLIFLFGRQAHSLATVEGPPELTDRLLRARLGI
ncbi:TIGR03085 family metal-binding protein [Catelliglobosispora koreensis]|uniref:TIGR03085 family metal-binding protein n=1 Tax=Catelliglobosispora koreensis TaxID=129052 RepID=UPI0003712C29|nr:TIGR03085 family metal-binding protein [Catelliglobosispora koreensis]